MSSSLLASLVACGDSASDSADAFDAAFNVEAGSSSGSSGSSGTSGSVGDGGLGAACTSSATCTSPPAPSCANASVVRTFGAAGTCRNGVCSYAPADASCAAPANADGVCISGKCTDFVCRAGFLRLGAGCVFGTAHDTWTTVAEIKAPRYFHGAALGDDGRLYAVGGVRSPAGSPVEFFSKSVEGHALGTNTWTALADAPTGSQGPAVVARNGKIFRIGGATALEALTTSTGSWETLASLPVNRFALAGAAGGAGDDRLYAVGGTLSAAGEKTTYAYGLAAGTWSLVASMAESRLLHAVAAGLDGRIFAIGGLTNLSNGVTLASAEVYTPSANAWTSIAPMTTPRSRASAATALDGRIFVFGGMNASANQLGTVEVYSPSTNTWKAAANMPGPRIHAAAALGGDGRIYVIGGGTGVGSGGYTTVFAYTP